MGNEVLETKRVGSAVSSATRLCETDSRDPGLGSLDLGPSQQMLSQGPAATVRGTVFISGGRSFQLSPSRRDVPNNRHVGLRKAKAARITPM
jgi:hypothetical protein